MNPKNIASPVIYSTTTTNGQLALSLCFIFILGDIGSMGVTRPLVNPL